MTQLVGSALQRQRWILFVVAILWQPALDACAQPTPEGFKVKSLVSTNAPPIQTTNAASTSNATGPVFTPAPSIELPTANVPDVAPTPNAIIQRLPPTVDDHQSQNWKSLSIDEAVLMALDNNKYLRALSFRTPLWQTRIDEAAAIFDPIFEAGGIYESDTSQLTSQVTAAGTGALRQTAETFTPPPEFGDNVSWSKRYGNGTTLQFNYNGQFERLDPAGDFRLVNPAWRSGLSVGVNKPLLRGAGLTANHAKINIAAEFYQRAAFDIQQAMNYLARTVRRAYWDLEYATRMQQILRTASDRVAETYQNEEKRYKIGASDRAKVAQARELQERFKILELDSRQGIVEKERRLRQLIGICGFDGEKFVVTGDANEEPLMDWDAAVSIALNSRPDVAAQRAHIEAFRHEVALRENERLPNLSVVGRASLGGLDDDWPGSVGETFTGNNPGYMVGMVYRRRVNMQKENALLRRAQLNVAQQQAYLDQLEFDITHEMQRAFQSLVRFRQRREMQVSRLNAANERLAASEKQYRSRKLGNLDYLLRAQEAQTDAELSLARAIADYRKAIEEWDYQRGVILARWCN